MSSALSRFREMLRYSSVRIFVIEVVLVVVALGFSIIGAAALLADVAESPTPIPEAFRPASLTVTVVLMIPLLAILLARRRWPLTVAVCSTALLLLIRELFVPELQVSTIAWLIALFAAGRHGRYPARQTVRALVVLSVLVFIAYDVVGTREVQLAQGMSERAFLLNVVSAVLWNLVLFGGAWLAGDFARNRASRERELAARTLELEASREENARRAVMDERVRIAREIHDVVAHHVSVMGVQAGAARRAVKVEPARAEGPLRAIETSSREAVQELHRLLGFLRRIDEVDPDGLAPDALMPRPSLDRFPDLRRQLADAGLAIRFTMTGEERPLPPSVDLNAYRILQEALTNCLKYAGVDQADVELDYGEDRLRLAVRDRGRGPTNVEVAVGSGAGLPGMAERVALLGGDLRHGGRPGGGFEVVADLPFSGQVAAAPSAAPSHVSQEVSS